MYWLIVFVKGNGAQVHSKAKVLYIQSYIETIMNQGDLYGSIAGWRRDEERKAQREGRAHQYE